MPVTRPGPSTEIVTLVSTFPSTATLPVTSTGIGWSTVALMSVNLPSSERSQALAEMFELVPERRILGTE